MARDVEEFQENPEDPLLRQLQSLITDPRRPSFPNTLKTEASQETKLELDFNNSKNINTREVERPPASGLKNFLHFPQRNVQVKVYTKSINVSHDPTPTHSWSKTM